MEYNACSTASLFSSSAKPLFDIYIKLNFTVSKEQRKGSNGLLLAEASSLIMPGHGDTLT